MEDYIIKIENVSKVYRLYQKPIDRLYDSLGIRKGSKPEDFYALDNISFAIKKGETIGIIGKNGSGKSTILKIITGVLSQSEGKVKVCGKISALLELGAGFNSEYSGMENIYLNGMMMGYTHEEMRKRIPDILSFADIGDFINQPIKTYSSGMFARLAFAVAINVDPEILIVDEALSVGDMKFQIKCMNRMKEMMAGGTTVLFVSHDTNAIRRFCTRAIWLKEGKLESDGDTNYVIDRYCEYLKITDIASKDKEEKYVKKSKFNDNSSIIAEIKAFNVMNANNVNLSSLLYNECIKIEIEYAVYDRNIDNPVIGVALLGIDDEYICGLNTLLDEISIPWELGYNKLVLEYKDGIRVVSGKYYFNVAIFDQTATVNIQYISKVKEIEVYSKYVGEGKIIIPHKWKG